jgi:hypothetical protein
MELDVNTLATGHTPIPGPIPADTVPIKAAPPSMRTATVVLYLVLAAAVLVPGIMLQLNRGFGQAQADAALRALDQSLQDIRFGYGLRFWLGVTGATAMGLLLLYPIRKTLAQGRWLGRIGVWFHIHIIFGIFGPVLIAYHSNFGLGGPNANVALWAMLAVAVSGIIGHFVYASISASFYANKLKAREQLAAIDQALGQLQVMAASRGQIVDGLAALEAELLTPRQGVLASLLARWRLEKRKRTLARAISWHLAESTEQLGLAEPEHERLRGAIGRDFGAYIRTARHASSRSIREQIWARWRLFHLPAFIIMMVATVLHVAAVWNMDPPERQAAALDPAIATSISAGAETSANGRAETSAPNQRRVATTPIEAPSPAITPPAPVRATRPALPVTAQTSETPAAATPPKLTAEPTPVPQRPEPKRVEQPKAVEIAKPIAAPVPVVKTPELKAPETNAAEPQLTSAPKAIAKSPPPPKAAPTVDPAVAELSRRPEAAPMSLGGAKPRTLAEQIEVYKARLKAKTFFHSDAETGFALTGKHTKVDCAACHQAPLSETRSSDPRACVSCHKKDDIHRGRRPDCVQCHTTNRWSEILKKR